MKNIAYRLVIIVCLLMGCRNVNSQDRVEGVYIIRDGYGVDRGDEAPMFYIYTAKKNRSITIKRGVMRYRDEEYEIRNTAKRVDIDFLINLGGEYKSPGGAIIPRLNFEMLNKQLGEIEIYTIWPKWPRVQEGENIMPSFKEYLLYSNDKILIVDEAEYIHIRGYDYNVYLNYATRK